jgi:hypothetical protein
MEQALLDEFGDRWETDARYFIPDFVIFDEERMLHEIDRVREAYGASPQSMSDLGVIKTVLRNMDEGKTTVPAAWWWISAGLIVTPHMEDSPWYQLLWWVYEDMRGKRQVTTLWGSASSSKSSFFASMIMTTMVIWHGGAHAYVTCPYKNAGDDKIFREITKWTNIWQEKPPAWAVRLGISINSTKTLVTFTDEDGKTSAANLVSLESTASVQGKKRDRFDFPHGAHPKTGAVILVGDELIINPSACKEYWDGTANLVANNNFMGWVGMNPLPHQVKHPNTIKLSAPVDRPMASLKESTDFTWKTARGRVIRLCMANSPNRYRREPVFSYLINLEQAEEAGKGGDQSYAAQVAAWGWSGGVGNGGVCTLDAVTSPHLQSEPVWASGERDRWIVFDLAFGGKDPAGYCAMEKGNAILGSGSGVPVLSAIEQQLTHVTKRWTPTVEEIQDFVRLTTHYGGKPPMMEAGVEMEAAPLIVLRMLQISHKLGIPRGRVSFDSSLRPDVTTIARDALGHVPWYYDGNRALKDDERHWNLYPPRTKEDNTPAKWSDRHRRTISAVWRLAEHVMAAGHVHNLTKVSTGCLEILNRPWVDSGTTSDVMGKKELPTSPIYGETLALAIMFGIRFCGALPQLAKVAPIAIGGAPMEMAHDVFQLRPYRLSRRMWG